MALKKSELYSSLWSSCDELRGGMDASQYKDYVLVLLFIKYISDKYAGMPFAPITIPAGSSFRDMVALKGKPDVGDQINKKIIAPLANANKLSDFPDFNDAAKLGSGKEMVDRLTNLIAIFENPALDFSKNRAEGDDILGDAYEYLMRHFATESGKSKGQFYTPAEVSRIMAQIVGIREARTTSDTIQAQHGRDLRLSLALVLVDALSVEPQRPARIGVPQQVLRCLHGRPVRQQPCRVGSQKRVPADQLLDARFPRSRLNHLLHQRSRPVRYLTGVEGTGENPIGMFREGGIVPAAIQTCRSSLEYTLDILRRSLADGRIYYLLHIKPSKFDRARVIPIGDSLGRVLAEIIRYVKRFYNSDSVPVCDHWDLLEKRPRPAAPYIIQAIRYPSTAGIQTIRGRIRELSICAEARRSDGSPLVLLPHDCRRVFASEHLNNNTPVHIIQALLGHASPDTVMIYAKLYPSRLVDEYRKTVESLLNLGH